jgi:monoamine oxidase
LPAHQLPLIDWGKPPGRLKRVLDEKLAAACELQYARITKTAVLCAQRFWPKPRQGGFSVFTTLASDYCFDSTLLQEGERGILCSYAIGDKADDIAASPLRKLKEWIAGDVANAVDMGWTNDRVRDIALAVKRQAWQEEEITLGAYAFYRPGQWFTLRKPLADALGNVVFAGEHIADAQGFMEGAVVTGQDAADELIKLAGAPALPRSAAKVHK